MAEPGWSATPRNPLVGAWADLISRIGESNLYKDLERSTIPDVLGVKSGAEEIDRWAYGNSPVEMKPEGPSIPSFKQGRAAPVLDATGVTPTAKALSLALKAAGPVAGMLGAVRKRGERIWGSKPDQFYDSLSHPEAEFAGEPAGNALMETLANEKFGKWLERHAGTEQDPYRRTPLFNEKTGVTIGDLGDELFDRVPGSEIVRNLHRWDRHAAPRSPAQGQLEEFLQKHGDELNKDFLLYTYPELAMHSLGRAPNSNPFEIKAGYRKFGDTMLELYNLGEESEPAVMNVIKKAEKGGWGELLNARMPEMARALHSPEQEVRGTSSIPGIKPDKGMTWVQLQDPGAWQRESGNMRNCVSGYCPQPGDPWPSKAFSLREEGSFRPKVTVKTEPGTWNVEEVKGFANSQVQEKYAEQVARLLREHPLLKYDNQDIIHSNVIKLPNGELITRTQAIERVGLPAEALNDPRWTNYKLLNRLAETK